jgi:Na+-driven multidrug efflux pump
VRNVCINYIVHKTKTLKVDKGIVAAAVATVVGSAVGMTAGILKALRNRKK